MFEKASKLKLRFETTKGDFTVEDLWDLNLTALDNLAKAVNKKLKEESEESFIAKKSTVSSLLELKLEILKHIITSKLKEQEDRKVKAERMEELALLEGLLANKKVQQLEALSPEEIQNRIAALKGQ